MFFENIMGEKSSYISILPAMPFEKGVGDNDRSCSVQTIGERPHTPCCIEAHQLMYLRVRHCNPLLRETKIKKHSTRQQEQSHRR